MMKNLSFLAVEEVVHTREIAVRRVSASNHMAPIVLPSGIFLTLSNVSKLLQLSADIGFDQAVTPILRLQTLLMMVNKRSLSSSSKSLFLIRRNLTLYGVSDHWRS
ncbi:hypothetical protein TNIN_237021 [Trichonephila inaurata madagascariensis]|uniref:Uncharacterized protein n=1 Tax=Trichonephila inaurata madagascariensis TaxID=2747483 RepID=A0A8X6XHA0_9ARAC|nr:hypothetical protein TNIN_237021 [Trichonephila inaurata madagascariensis]